MTSGKQGKKNRRNNKNMTSSTIQSPLPSESVENAEKLAGDEIEKKNPIDEKNLKLKTLKESIDEIRNTQKSDMERLENQQNSMMEELRLIRENTEKKKDSDESKKPSFNSVISPGSLMKSTSSNEVPPVGRSFLLYHTFKDFSKFEEEKWNCSEEEEHFGVPWSILVCKKEQHLEMYLKCCKSLENTGKWTIDTKFTPKLIGVNSKIEKSDLNYTYGNHEANKDSYTAWGKSKFITLDELATGIVVDDNLTVEIHVKINKMTGIFKENLRSFDESTAEFSDVVLIVNDQKFYVLKLFLATYSPYFKALFLGQFQETNKSEIELTGIESEDFQNYLEVLYGHGAIDETTVEGILLIADMYDTSIVIKKCEEFLLEKSKKSNKKKLQMSIRYNLDKLKKNCLSEIKSVADFKSVIPGKLKDLEPSIMTEFFEKLISLS